MPPATSSKCEEAKEMSSKWTPPEGATQAAKDAHYASRLVGVRPPDFQGALKRRGGLLPVWKDAYYRLYDNMLVEYDKEGNKFRVDSDVYEAKANVLNRDEGEFALAFKGNSEPLRLKAGTTKAMEKWLAKLCYAGVDAKGAVNAQLLASPRSVPGSPPIGPTDKWTCSKCTLLNAAAVDVCVICHAPWENPDLAAAANGEGDMADLPSAAVDEAPSSKPPTDPEQEPAKGTSPSDLPLLAELASGDDAPAPSSEAQPDTTPEVSAIEVVH